MIDEGTAVVCCGMRRSGSTLQFNLVRLLLETAGIQVNNLRYVEGQSLAATIRNSRQEGVVTLVKCHDVQAAAQVADTRTLLCYTFRDPRDAYLSLKYKCGADLNNLSDIMREFEHSFRHATSASHVISQRYEDLYGNEFEAASELAIFLKINLTDRELSDVARRVSLAEIRQPKWAALYTKLRNQARYFSRSSRVARVVTFPLKEIHKQVRHVLMRQSTTQLHADHISKNNGMPGSWFAELSEAEKQMICQDYSELLELMGYDNHTHKL